MHVILDGSALAVPIAELGALVDDERAGRPRVGEMMAVTLVGARVGLLGGRGR